MHGLYLPVDCKDGTDWSKAVNVWRAIERIEADHIFALWTTKWTVALIKNQSILTMKLFYSSHVLDPLRSPPESYPAFRLYDDGFLILLCNKHTWGEGRLDHVNNQVVREDVELLHLVPCHICGSSDAITKDDKSGWNTAAPWLISLTQTYKLGSLLIKDNTTWNAKINRSSCTGFSLVEFCRCICKIV